MEQLLGKLFEALSKKSIPKQTFAPRRTNSGYFTG